MARTTEEINEEATRQHRQRVTDYLQTFRSEAGARVLKDLEEYCHMYDSCIRTTARDTDIMLGERNVFLYILAMMSEDPNKEIVEEVKDYE
jgi:translation initiation factor 2 beta subunit (eIF-2beta)/eIF-5